MGNNINKTVLAKSLLNKTFRTKFSICLQYYNEEYLVKQWKPFDNVMPGTLQLKINCPIAFMVTEVHKIKHEIKIIGRITDDIPLLCVGEVRRHNGVQMITMNATELPIVFGDFLLLRYLSVTISTDGNFEFSTDTGVAATLLPDGIFKLF